MQPSASILVTAVCRQCFGLPFSGSCTKPARVWQ